MTFTITIPNSPEMIALIFAIITIVNFMMVSRYLILAVDKLCGTPISTLQKFIFFLLPVILGPFFLIVFYLTDCYGLKNIIKE